MTPSRSPEWQAENKSMDLLAILATARDHVEVAKARVYHQAPAKRTFVELTAACRDLDILGQEMSNCWDKLYALAQERGEEK